MIVILIVSPTCRDRVELTLKKVVDEAVQRRLVDAVFLLWLVGDEMAKAAASERTSASFEIDVLPFSSILVSVWPCPTLDIKPHLIRQ